MNKIKSTCSRCKKISDQPEGMFLGILRSRRFSNLVWCHNCRVEVNKQDPQLLRWIGTWERPDHNYFTSADYQYRTQNLVSGGLALTRSRTHKDNIVLYHDHTCRFSGCENSGDYVNADGWECVQCHQKRIEADQKVDKFMPEPRKFFDRVDDVMVKFDYDKYYQPPHKVTKPDAVFPFDKTDEWDDRPRSSHNPDVPGEKSTIAAEVSKIQREDFGQTDGDKFTHASGATSSHKSPFNFYPTYEGAKLTSDRFKAGNTKHENDTPVYTEANWLKAYHSKDIHFFRDRAGHALEHIIAEMRGNDDLDPGGNLGAVGWFQDVMAFVKKNDPDFYEAIQGKRHLSAVTHCQWTEDNNICFAPAEYQVNDEIYCGVDPYRCFEHVKHLGKNGYKVL